MRRVATVAIVLLATIIGALQPALAQRIAPPNNPLNSQLMTVTRPLPPLAWYGIGSIACVAVSPMIATVILGRELTIPEADRMALSCFLGPVGWLLGPVLFPDAPVVTTTPPSYNPPPQHPRQAHGRHIDIPSRGVTAFVPNEILLEVEPGT